MQIKGAIKVFAIALTLVSLYQLSFTVATRIQENRAEEYATDAEGNIDTGKRQEYLDSISSEVVYNFLGIRKYTYREAKEREINLGLDLKGGMNVTLEISVIDLVKALSNYSQDETFQKALARAQQLQKESPEDFITLFGQAFEEIDPDGRLAAIFNTVELRDRIDFNSTNEEVLKVIRDETTGAIDNSFNILRSRIDRFGVSQPNIQRLETHGRILVELPGIKDPERVRKLLQGTANLEFWETYENQEVYQYLLEANDVIKQIEEAEKELDIEKPEEVDYKPVTEEEVISPEEPDTAEEEISLLEQLEEADTSLTDTALTENQMLEEYPLFSVLQPNVTRDNQLVKGSMIGLAHFKDTGKVNEYLSLKQVRALFPRNIKFFWSAKPFKYDESGNFYELHAIKVTTRDGQPPMDGDAVTNATADFGQTGGDPEVSLSMNAEGAKTWARLTRDNIGKSIAIVLDGYVRSSPTVQNEIKGGNSQITGDFTIQEAQDLANILESGKMPAPARIIQEAIVGPSLGEEAIQAGLSSFIIAFIAVLIYMVFYYSLQAGMVANLALVANIFFIMGVLASLGAVLTLPGIAGIVLTLGMAVDANVLIYERIREELRAGKGLKKAVDDGYRAAYSAIIDGNATTLITGIILYIFGTGPIRGFATTLIIGILSSLFTAIFISRLIFMRQLDKNRTILFSTKLTENAFKNTKVKFIELRKTFYVVSVIIALAGIASLVTKGLNPGVDFTGGRTFVIKFLKQQDVSTADVRDNLATVFPEAPDVITFGDPNQVRITTEYMIDVNDTEVDAEIEHMVYEGVKPMLKEEVGFEEFISDYRQSSTKVGPTIADDIKLQAVQAIGAALLMIFLYIFIRFRNWRFGLGALAALAHDVLIVVGLYSLLWGIMPFSLEIDQAFIAAILTIVGYSINDTVVVFDRIREYFQLYPKRDRLQVYNSALNSTLSRTFSTSLSTFVVILIIFVFGGEVIRGFTFALLLGIVVGTYSSLFISTPVVYDSITRKLRKEGKLNK